jgi:ergothioneine biosynthesis protein EgtB
MRSDLGNRVGQTLDRRTALAARYREVRGLTESLCQPLEIEDYGVQSMPDASPPKWHLAHTTWFFETFVLAAHVPGFRPFHPSYNYLFNSYYTAAGERWPRQARGLLSRPTVREVYDYRHATDEHVLHLLDSAAEAAFAALAPVLELGLNHEQQHQELLLTDLKHAFALNPLRPAYRKTPPTTTAAGTAGSLAWTAYAAEVRWLGHDGSGFAYDNESPRHRVFVEAFQMAGRLVTAGEFLDFVEDGGYRSPEWWLSDGWQSRSTHGWETPLYWERREGRWWLMTLHGPRELVRDEPVCHVSYYEADAYARWAGARLPSEAEWETAAGALTPGGNFLDSGRLHPAPACATAVSAVGLTTADTAVAHGQFFGDTWEWTASPYVAYPGYRPPTGALGEYNGKFMCNQIVLRGGSCATPLSHLRPTYRNFFPPEARWQFSGIRLASDA